MKSFCLKALIIKGLILVFCPSLFSQNPNDTTKSYTVDEVVFSASRRLQNQLDAGKSISVIDQAEIKNSIFHSVAELLANQPGLHLTGSGQNFGASQRMFLRGSNSSHTVVMIDGVRISDPSSVDNSLDLAELSLNMIERIEIIKGSHSTLYGSSAMAGVVNIITKTQETNTVSLNTSLSAGSFGKNTHALHNDLSVQLNHKSGVYLLLGANQLSSDGLDATVDTVTNPAAFKNRDKDAFRSFNYSAKAGWKNAKTDLSVFYRYIDQYSELDKSAFVDDDNRFIEFKRHLLSWSASHALSKKLKLNYQGGYSAMNRWDNDDSSVINSVGDYDHTFADSRFEGSYFTQELIADLNLKNVSILTAAAYNEERMNISNFVYSNHPVFGLYEASSDLDSLNLRSDIKTAFIHLSLGGALLGERFVSFNLALGYRLINHSRFGFAQTYDINPSFKLGENAIIFYTASTGFNAPSLYRLYSPDKGWDAVTTRGNSYLKPERSRSHEIGIKGKLAANSFYAVSVFNNRIADLIEYVYLWDKDVAIDTLGNDWMRNDYRGDTYINVSQQLIYGVEFELSHRISRQLGLKANFTYLYGTSSFSSDGVDTSVTAGHHIQLFESGVFVQDNTLEKMGLARRPDAIVNISVDWMPVPKLQISFNNRFIGMRYDPYYNPVLGPYGAMDNKLMQAYTLSNLMVRYRFKENLSLSMKVENLFNTDYMEIYGFTTRPRGFYFKLDYLFSR